MRHPLAITGIVMLLCTAAPASGLEDPGQLRTERVYFTCIDGEREQDTNGFNGRFSNWNTTAPTQSRANGAGCVDSDTLPETQGTNGPGSPMYDVQWSGVSVGNLDSIMFEGHVWIAGVANPATGLKYSLAVDGEPTHSAAWVRADVTQTPVTASGFCKVTFQVDGLGYLDEEGTGTRLRTVDLRVDLPETPGVADPQPRSLAAVWEWGNSDAPSGLTFNPPGS